MLLRRLHHRPTGLSSRRTQQAGLDAGLFPKEVLRPAELLLQHLLFHTAHAAMAVAVQADFMPCGNHLPGQVRILLHPVAAEEKCDLGLPGLQALQ